jgi:hypothetical protein
VPKVFRTMLADESGAKPKMGSTTDEPGLGVRVPVDVKPDSRGVVFPGQGGMSVAPFVRVMPPRLVPARLKHLNRNASGDDDRVVWSLGEGPFVTASLGSALIFRKTSSTHGVVEPEMEILIDELQRLLTATQDKWRKA